LTATTTHFLLELLLLILWDAVCQSSLAGGVQCKAQIEKPKSLRDSGFTTGGFDPANLQRLLKVIVILVLLTILDNF